LVNDYFIFMLEMFCEEYMDMFLGEDVIEEIGRVYGYEHVDSAQLPERKPPVNKTFYYTNKIRDLLVAEGFSEAMTYTFVARGNLELQNPPAEDKRFLRDGLEQGLSQAFVANRPTLALVGSTGEEEKLFEIGTVFSGADEHLELCAMTGKKESAQNAIRHLGEALGKPMEAVATGTEDGCIVNLTTYLHELPEPTSYDDLVTIDTKGTVFKPFSPYPFVLRDIAVWIPDGEGSGEDVVTVVKKYAGALLARADMFDSFSKDGRTSYAYHLVFQSFEKTLSDEEVTAVMQKITDDLNARENWQVR
jgi:phenylalanyl-tRNA synthetase beta subunit